MSNVNNAEMFVIGHDHFNKSLTLDIENKMMLYMTSVPQVKKINNRRENQQDEYYTADEMDGIFSKAWLNLQKYDEDLFPVQSIIEDSAIFKASPFHQLTSQQESAREDIIDHVIDALNENKVGQLILVEGEAGSGKTVLLSTLFYQLSQLKSNVVSPEIDNLNNYLIVNHDEQLKVYEDIAKKLGMMKNNKQTVLKPTRFINKHSVDNKADVVLIDEAHLLWTQGKQAYRGKNQLEDVMDRAKIVIAVFDPKQILKTEGYMDSKSIQRLRRKAKNQGNLIQLTNQMRMNANEDTIQWIRNIVDNRMINKVPEDAKYDLKIFDDAKEMYDQIKIKSRDGSDGLSRMVATFDWEFKGNRSPEEGSYWMVDAGDISLPWNLQLPVVKLPGRKVTELPWAEQPQTINEIGSTYTIQGFDLNYCGLIIGPSVKYRNGQIIFDPGESYNEHATRNRTMDDGKKITVYDKLLPNELNVLMTRGVNGLYIYAVDNQLREALENAAK
ncbi:hypothetical protein NBRC111893_385 [Lentilactobacillus kosonis]|uniref:AAA+ ATPase domain-containing protein n=1 Tax=Lentilactobacillus kosonis TaxID=2810561 RepID=A0A401FIQ8_9LACO|nr:DNA/RNA helicase domain-containing protein [Lentilactobacillus kosonis]GAY72239.1 hypothetical protein NBRC111893_385 [Lentilactobacillus kosonis]